MALERLVTQELCPTATPNQLIPLKITLFVTVLNGTSLPSTEIDCGKLYGNKCAAGLPENYFKNAAGVLSDAGFKMVYDDLPECVKKQR